MLSTTLGKALVGLALLASSLSLGAQQHSPLRSVQADRVPDFSDSNLVLPLSGHLPAWASPEADAGAVPPEQLVSLSFGISRAPAVQARFDQLSRELTDPHSAHFHQWLTPQGIGERFGPTDHDLDALKVWLTTQGFHIDNISAARTVVQVSAPAATVGAALRTSLRTYRLTRGGRTEVLRAPTAEPSLPAALTPIVSYIGGLAGVALRTHAVQMPPVPVVASGIVRANALGTAATSPDYTLGGGSTHLLSPSDFAQIYNLNPAYRAGIDGTGQRVMIIGGSHLNVSDLSTWESLANLPQYQPNYRVGTAFTDPGQTDNDDMGEGTLDFERVYGTAPGAQVDMVIAKNWLSGTIASNLILYAIDTVNDPVMSLSFGSCENDQTPSYVRYEDSIYSQAAMQGISVFVSSGDAGVAGCENHGVAAPASQIGSINDICATSYVTCVGGTQFSDTASPSLYWAPFNSTGKFSALSYIPEGAWNEPQNQRTGAFVVAATGGGPSTVISKPAWQTGAGVPGDGARDTPDVSFSASVHNAYFSCLAYMKADCSPGGFITGFGGTSASAPSMAGIAALLVQKLGARQGNLNPALYALAATNPEVFHDANPATSGVSSCTTATPSTCNNSDPAPSSLSNGIVGFPLTPGYDLATGLGSLDVSNLLNALTSTGGGATPPPPTPTPAPTPNPTYSFTVAQAALAFAAGATSANTNTLNISSRDGYTGSFAISCTVAFNGTSSINIVLPTCTPTPASVSVGTSAPLGSSGSSILAITSVAPRASSSLKAATSPDTHIHSTLALCGLLLVALPLARRRTRAWPPLLSLLLLSVALAGLSGCGSGGNFSGATAVAPAVLTGTPPGSYTVTVSGSTGSLAHPTVQFALTIQ